MLLVSKGKKKKDEEGVIRIQRGFTFSMVLVGWFTISTCLLSAGSVV